MLASTTFSLAFWDGDVALPGDGYVERQWDFPDVTALISYLIEHRELLDDKRMHWLRSLARWTRRKTGTDGCAPALGGKPTSATTTI